MPIVSSQYREVAKLAATMDEEALISASDSDALTVHPATRGKRRLVLVGAVVCLIGLVAGGSLAMHHRQSAMDGSALGDAVGLARTKQAVLEARTKQAVLEARTKQARLEARTKQAVLEARTKQASSPDEVIPPPDIVGATTKQTAAAAESDDSDTKARAKQAPSPDEVIPPPDIVGARTKQTADAAEAEESDTKDGSLRSDDGSQSTSVADFTDQFKKEIDASNACHSAFAECSGACTKRWNHSMYADQLEEGNKNLACVKDCSASRSTCLKTQQDSNPRIQWLRKQAAKIAKEEETTRNHSEHSIKAMLAAAASAVKKLTKQTDVVTGCHTSFTDCSGDCTKKSTGKKVRVGAHTECVDKCGDSRDSCLKPFNSKEINAGLAKAKEALGQLKKMSAGTTKCFAHWTSCGKGCQPGLVSNIKNMLFKRDTLGCLSKCDFKRDGCLKPFRITDDLIAKIPKADLEDQLATEIVSNIPGVSKDKAFDLLKGLDGGHVSAELMDKVQSALHDSLNVTKQLEKLSAATKALVKKNNDAVAKTVKDNNDKSKELLERTTKHTQEVTNCHGQYSKCALKCTKHDPQDAKDQEDPVGVKCLAACTDERRKCME